MIILATKDTGIQRDYRGVCIKEISVLGMSALEVSVLGRCLY